METSNIKYKNAPSTKNHALIEIMLAGVLWGLIGLFVRRLNTYGLEAPAQVAWRATLSAAAMFCWLTIKNPSALKIRLRDVWMFIGTGIISFVLFNYCYFGAIERIPLSLAAVLLYTAPVFVMLMSRIIFKEPITRRKTLALIFAFLGCVLSAGITVRSGGSVSGIILGLMSGFLYALYSIFGRFALMRYKAATVTAYTFLAASIVTVPFLWQSAGNVSASPGIIWFLALFAVASGVLPYLLYTKGLAKTSPDRASIIASIEPVTATVIGALYFSEPITLLSGSGIALVIAAIILLNTEHS